MKLTNTKRAIRRIVSVKKIDFVKPLDKRKLSRSLLRDLLREIRGVKLSQMAKLADKLVDEFIVPELNRVMKGVAAA